MCFVCFLCASRASFRWSGLGSISFHTWKHVLPSGIMLRNKQFIFFPSAQKYASILIWYCLDFGEIYDIVNNVLFCLCTPNFFLRTEKLFIIINCFRPNIFLFPKRILIPKVVLVWNKLLYFVSKEIEIYIQKNLNLLRKQSMTYKVSFCANAGQGSNGGMCPFYGVCASFWWCICFLLMVTVHH